MLKFGKAPAFAPAVCFILGILGLLAASPAGAALTFGAIGDSLTDEYQFIPDDRRFARGYVELLAAHRGLDFGPFSAASRGEPRDQGYANNWANAGLSIPGGITTSLMTSTGQVSGLLSQSGAGQVDVAFMTIGGNDFRSIFLGADPATVVTGGVTNHVTAIMTLLASDPDLRLVVGNVADVTKIPEAQAALAANPALAPAFAQVSAAVDIWNAQVAGAVGTHPRVAIADLNAVLKGLTSDPRVGGITLDVLNPSPAPDHLFVDSIHPGTIGQGFLANAMLAAMDEKFGIDYPLFTEGELLGIANGVAAVPLPGAIWGGLAGAALVLRRRRGRTSHGSRLRAA